MSEIFLIEPSMQYAEAIMELKNEFVEYKSKMAGCGMLGECETAEDWIQSVQQFSNDATVPEGKVASDSYIAVRSSDNKIVGTIDFRHHINHPILEVWGGHIGYAVRPTERKKGYATEMLRLNLINCKVYGLDRVLVTCDEDNIASKTVIQNNGGVFEHSVTVNDRTVERYWIQLD